MENYNQRITYYCFNKNCLFSIYNARPVELVLPFNLTALSNEHFCSDCGHKLVSLVDIEIRQALASCSIDNEI